MTLLETLIVMAVSAMLAALAFPSLERSVERFAIMQARVAFVADLRVARAAAMRQGQAVLVGVSPDGTTYQIQGRRTALPSRLRLSVRARQPIAFHPDGSATPATVAIATPDNIAWLRIAPATGIILPLERRP